MEKGISVVIPAYNEEGSIKETLDQLNEVLDNIEHEIITYPNSGHGFLTEDYNDMFYKIINFIEKHKK